MELPSNVLVALKASLQNADHEWVMTGQMTHGQTRTYQLQSQPLTLMLPITVEVSQETVAIQVFYQGTSFETGDEELFGILDGMAGPSAAAAANQLLSILEVE